MPYCKYCHKEISKFDSDVCPYCGNKNPIEEDYKTMDVTTSIGKMGNDFSLYKSKSHKKFALYAMFLGMLGVHNFYIGKKKLGYINVATSILIELSLGLILYFSNAIKNALAFFIPVFVLFLTYFIIGIYYLRKDSLKDASGEFLR